MKVGARARATYEDLLRVPENLVAELIDGELYTWPRPAGPHARFSSALGMDIGSAYDRGRGGPGGWWIIDEPEVHFKNDVVVPDIAGWRRERMPELPQDHRFVVEPDWICEVLSPSTARIDRGKKMQIYAGGGVPWIWLVDPEGRTLEIMNLTGDRWSVVHVYTGNDIVCAEPFPAAEIDLASIWGPTPEDRRP